jgi:hypothetical protein
VIPGIDQKPVRALGKITGPKGLDNLTVLAEQHPAAFGGPRTERVGENGFENAGVDGYFSFQHSAISFQLSAFRACQKNVRVEGVKKSTAPFSFQRAVLSADC